VPITDQVIPGTNMVQLGTLADGDRGQKIFDYFVNGGYATYDPTYGWIADKGDVGNVSGSFFPSSNTEAMGLFAGLVGGGLGLGSLMGGGLGGLGGLGEGLAGGLGEGLAGGLGEGLAGGLGEGLGAGIGELGSGTYGLGGGGLLDPAVTGTGVFGETIGTGAGVGAGAGGGTVTNTFNPLDPSTWGNAPTTPPTSVPGGGGNTPGTTNTGTGTGTGAGNGIDWSNIANWGVNDWVKALGPLGGSIFDYLGDQASGDAATDWYNRAMSSPGMTRFNESFAPGWNIMNADPAFQGALDQTANAATRAYSAKVGNVAGNPGAQGEIGNYIMNSALVPWTNTYRSQNLTAAGLGANMAGTFAAPSINAAGSGYDNAGAFLGSLGKSDNPWEDFLKSNNLKFGSGLA